MDECPGSLNVWQSPSHCHVDSTSQSVHRDELKDKGKNDELSNNNGRQGSIGWSAASLYVQNFFSPDVQLNSPRCIGRSSQIVRFLKTLEKKDLD
jgi:hypothetical protein